jgi:high affinity Mn2+ porin
MANPFNAGAGLTRASRLGDRVRFAPASRNRERASTFSAALIVWAIALMSVLTAPRTKAAETPAASPPAATGPTDDLDAERRELERQRREIDQKLADLDARRRARAAAMQPGAPEPPAGGTATPRHDDAITQPPGRPEESIQTTPEPKWFNAHAQATAISQGHDAFHAPYSGLNSLPRHEPWRTSVTGTLFLGAHLPWRGGQIYFDPEVAGGEGLGGVRGIAGFPNGEIPRVGTPEPEPYIARLFYRQTFGFGGETEKVEDGPNQLEGVQDVSRLTVTVGKFGAVDFLQQNSYTNDPRGQFFNWALFTDGAWDYPADTRGYTEGGVVEFNQPIWALRYAAMAEPKVANGGTLDSRVLNALGQSLEFEQRWKVGAHPGAARLMGFYNNSHAGKYQEALEHPGPHGPDVTLSRTFRGKYGFGLSAEQEVADGVGVFGRLSWNDGHSETWAFTEIDRSAALGVSIKGTRWHRPEDVVGIAGVINGISKDHRDYLAAGGFGFIIGDGRLNYGYEEILEAYYLCKVADHIFVTPDFQFVQNPAYNRDRGPVSIGGVRVHIEF